MLAPPSDHSSCASPQKTAPHRTRSSGESPNKSSTLGEDGGMETPKRNPLGKRNAPHLPDIKEAHRRAKANASAARHAA